MAQNQDYKLGYSRGYNAASGRNWHAHRPPMPPDEIVRGFLVAARELRDAIDGQLAVFGEDDEIALELGPLIDALDDQFIKMNAWLTSPPPAPVR